ncbi:hypothetical protein KFL_000260150 [Klebsormidium nitens]|uniref:Protein arginine methyltransferase NDUFAF7 n=1 Tax=Klebsormidium nitens TaxID=105231 RepID=A0A1Y1HPR6_KLENI|nr:hypothetical protein KFL_000260150 [Klebsormidium nitens]|eukprot:GAQ79199.1 hypothetical protein KFL_000260150 [Klebsormidium nitens]
MHYTSIEISESLAAEQRKTVHAKRQHQSKFKVEVRNAADVAAWGPPSDEPCFVIMLEVLDNLPHDRVFRSSRHDPWLQTMVTSSQPGLTSATPSPDSSIPPSEVQDPSSSPLQFRELLAPVRDPLIRRCLAALEPGGSEAGPLSGTEPPDGTEPVKANVTGLLALAREFFGSLAEPPEGLEVLWLPTGALQLLETLYAARPNMCLVAADFDALPDVRIEGRNAPLVASKADGVTQDQSTYLVQPGIADIFFPTDFDVLHRLNLAAAHWSKAGHVPSANSASTRAFMEQFGDVKRTRTRTGFNPLLEDYLNTKIFVSQPGTRFDGS